jgi:hypothetical protein
MAIMLCYAFEEASARGRSEKGQYPMMNGQMNIAAKSFWQIYINLSVFLTVHCPTDFPTKTKHQY